MENNLKELASLIVDEVNRQSSNISSQMNGLSSSVSFKEAVELELFRKQSRGHSEKTVIGFKSSMKKFYSFAASIGKLNNLERITIEDMEDYVIQIRNEQLQPRTINMHINAVRMLFKTLVQRERIEKDPTKFLVLERTVKKKRKILSFEQIRSVMLSFDLSRNAHMVGLALFSLQSDIGCRVSELVNLRVENLSLSKLHITYYANKNKVEVITPISPVTALILKVYIKNILNEKRKGYLFVKTDKYGKTISNEPLTTNMVRIIYREVGERADLDFIVNTHMIRRTKITHHLINGGDLASAQELVGHKDIRSTSEYVHFTGEHLRTKHSQYGVFGKSREVSYE